MRRTKPAQANRPGAAEAAAEWETSSSFRAEYARQYPFEHVADALLQLRADLGWTQQELAKRANTTQSVIARAESGRHSFQISLLDRIASAANVRWRPRFEPADQAGDNIIVLANAADRAGRPYTVADVDATGPAPSELALTANSEG